MLHSLCPRFLGQARCLVSAERTYQSERPEERIPPGGLPSGPALGKACLPGRDLRGSEKIY